MGRPKQKNLKRVKVKKHVPIAKTELPVALGPEFDAKVAASGREVGEATAEDASNALILPASRKRSSEETAEGPHVKRSKNLLRKLRRLQEEKEKKEKRTAVLETLQQHQLEDTQLSLLHSTGRMGQADSVKEKLKRALQYERAGLPLPQDSLLFRHRPQQEPRSLVSPPSDPPGGRLLKDNCVPDSEGLLFTAVPAETSGPLGGTPLPAGKDPEMPAGEVPAGEGPEVPAEMEKSKQQRVKRKERVPRESDSVLAKGKSKFRVQMWTGGALDQERPSKALKESPGAQSLQHDGRLAASSNGGAPPKDLSKSSWYGQAASRSLQMTVVTLPEAPALAPANGFAQDVEVANAPAVQGGGHGATSGPPPPAQVEDLTGSFGETSSGGGERSSSAATKSKSQQKREMQKLRKLKREERRQRGKGRQAMDDVELRISRAGVDGVGNAAKGTSVRQNGHTPKASKAVDLEPGGGAAAKGAEGDGVGVCQAAEPRLDVGAEAVLVALELAPKERGSVATNVDTTHQSSFGAGHSSPLGNEGGLSRDAMSGTHGGVVTGNKQLAESGPGGGPEAQAAATPSAVNVGRQKTFFRAVKRQEEIEASRAGLPILMMEQEIMEAVSNHPVVIICGETGCGKTTQLPQFLYEAGYGSQPSANEDSGAFGGVAGAIGVTQPRRVAVLATAKRVAQELDVALGAEVGFQVRYDKQVGDKGAIKFMTDGILLREVQADLLLRKYSVIVLDEAHERSLNTDILIGLLSRIVPLRQALYEEHLQAVQQEQLQKEDELRRLKKKKKKKGTAAKELLLGTDAAGTPSGDLQMPAVRAPPVGPLKLVIMSATLRVEDFVSNKRMFPVPPPVISVPARQYPVTVHFSRRTELADYEGAAFRKVVAIHRKLPPGGVLVFVTGQREVEHLCHRLRKAFAPSRNKRPLGARFGSQAPGAIYSEVGGGVHGGQGSNSPRAEGGEGVDDVDDAAAISTIIMGTCGEEPGQGSSRGQFDRDEGDGEASDHEDMALSDDEEEDDEDEEEEDWEQADRGLDGGRNGLAGMELGPNPTNLEGDPWKDIKPLSSLPGAAAADPLEAVAGGQSSKVPTGPGPVLVLPLYAMLAAPAQMQVFKKVPAGTRLIVVATNVAETSITIPGIKYVVDTGRAKQRCYDRGSGVSSFEVRWISKAAADQRAGRAGRTGPGHCYRLYSSAHFSNAFPKFSAPEIGDAPIDGVVLQMKAMGIDKVVNFPFPTPPDRGALAEAERCLKALSALSQQTGVLTPVGRAMAAYPVSPRHSRMLQAVLTAVRTCGHQLSQAPLLLAYAVACVAALSLESPLRREGGSGEEEASGMAGSLPSDSKSKLVRTSDGAIDNQEEAGEKVELTKEDKKRRGERRRAASSAQAAFRDRISDALTSARALRAYERDGLAASRAGWQEAFCALHHLVSKTMQEMSLLRKQLLRIVRRCCDADVSGSTPAGPFGEEARGQPGITLLGELLRESDAAWYKAPEEEGSEAVLLSRVAVAALPSPEESILRRAICAGWADRVARKLSPGEVVYGSDPATKARKGVPYQACAVGGEVFIHPSSSVWREAPPFVVYNDIVASSRPYMWGVTSVAASWLPEAAPAQCTFSKPLADPAPWYDPRGDLVMCWVVPTFGPHLWELPLHGMPLAAPKQRTAVFATALLQGKVLPAFSELDANLAARPGIVMKQEGQGHKRVAELLHRLGSGPDAVYTRAKLAARWATNPLFLFQELTLWIQGGNAKLLEKVWPRLKEEAKRGH